MLPEKRYRLADMVDATARNLEHQAAGQLVGRARDNIEQANQRLISAANTRGSGVTTRQKRNEVAGMLSQNALEHGLQATDQLTQATRLVQAGAGKHEQTERASSPAANTRDSVAA